MTAPASGSEMAGTVEHGQTAYEARLVALGQHHSQFSWHRLSLESRADWAQVEDAVLAAQARPAGPVTDAEIEAARVSLRCSFDQKIDLARTPVRDALEAAALARPPREPEGSVAMVVLHEGQKIIDGTIEFMAEAELGTRLYAAAPQPPGVSEEALARAIYDDLKEGDPSHWIERIARRAARAAFALLSTAQPDAKVEVGDDLTAFIRELDFALHRQEARLDDEPCLTKEEIIEAAYESCCRGDDAEARARDAEARLAAPPAGWRLPEHKASLTIQHNDHLAVYETARQWIEDNDEREFASWVSEEQRVKALETGSIWTLQWYPDTPVGFYALAAADLDALLAAAAPPPPDPDHASQGGGS